LITLGHNACMDAELRGLLHRSGFAWFLGARSLSGIANQMLLVALAWNMYDLTHSAWDLGLVGLYQFVPALVMTLPAGHAVDRWNRVHIFRWAVWAQALVAAAAGLAIWTHTDSKTLILVLSVILGVIRAFQMPTQQAMLPSLVPQQWLARAVALSSGVMQFGVIGGPALGGVLYAVDAGLDYLVCAILSVLALAASWGMPRLTRQTGAHPVGWAEVLAGLRFVRHRKTVLGAVTLDMFAVLLGGATALLPIYARDILDVGPTGLGLLRAAPAVGALAMSFALSRWPLHRRVGHKLYASIVCFGLATVLFGLSESFWLSWLALLLTGVADNVSVVIRSTIIQMETPDEMRGRVSAINSLFIGASNQLGEFESGAVAHLFGPVTSAVSGGLGTVLVAALWWKWFPSLAHRDKLEATPGH
jgi:MFS family permease